MEHNQEMKTKKKSLIPLIACIAVVVVCALATVGVLLLKNMGTDKEVATDTERIEIEQNEAGEMLAKDEASLRQLLLDDETYTIAITEDIYVSEPLTVNGTKTLVGDKSIIMNLNTPAKERVCSVSEGAHLILDGATIDGNGVSSGIEVEYGGKLDCLSGSIVYPMPYGIVTEGVVNVEDITIDRSMHTGIYVEAGGELYMNGGKITNCIQTGIATSTKAYAKVSKDAVIQKSAGSLFYNFGTLDITGGTFSESYSNCIYNKGELNIISESDDKLVEFFDSGRSVISSVAGTTVNIDGLYVHDIAAHAMNLEKDSVGDVKNVLVENTGKSSFYTNGSKLTMQDIELKDIKSVGINITNKSTVELKDITILNGGHRGIINDTSTVTMKDIKVDNLVGAGIITMGEKSVTKIENAKISKVGKSGIGITGGTVTAKDIEITDAAGTAIYTTTEKSKTTVDGAKLVNSGKSAIGVSIGTLTAKNVEINGTANTGVYIQKDAKLTLSDATIKGVHKHGIANYFGTAVVKNVSIEAPTNAGILNQGTLTGEKVTINKSGSRAMSLTDASTTNIKGLTINESKNQSVYIDGVTSAHISDFTIDKSGQSAFRITKSTDVLLKSGTITNANGDGIYVAEKAKIKVQDTTITKPVQHGVEILGEGAEVTAINVTVNEPTRAGLVNNGGTINGSVVKIEDSGSRAVSLINKSTTSVTGLTVKNAGDQGVYIDGTTKVVLKEIDIDKTKSAAIRVANADNVSIKTGTIKNAGTDAVYAGEASKMKVEAVDIKDTAKYGLNCVKGEITAIKVTVKDATAGIVNNAGTINGNTVAIEDTTSRGANLLAGSTTNITGLTIKNAGAQGIYVDSATKVSINGIDIDGTKQGAVAVVKATDVLIKGNAEAKLNTIKNVKTSAINTSEGAKIKVQDINIVGTEDEEKIKENTKYGLNIAKDSEITAVNVDIKNVVAGVYNDGGTFGGNTIAINTTSSRAVNLLSNSTANITDLTIKNAGDQGVYVESSAATISDFLVDTTKSAAISLGVPKETEGSNSAETAAKVTLNSGTIKASGTDGVYVGKTTTVNLTGVTIESAGRHGIYNDGGTVDGTTLTINQSTNRAVSMATDSETTINGLYITGTGSQAVYVDGGKEAKTEIKGFEISGSSSAAVRVMNTKDVKLTDGTINATSYGIATSDDATVIAEDVRINRIKGNENSLIWVMKDSTVTLQNGKDTKKESWSVVDGKGLSGRGVEIEENATFYLNNGTIQNNNLEKEESGAGILVKANGIFVMNNGTITKNNSTKSDGGGVHVEQEGTFTLNNGLITDNDAINCGAGVSVYGTFTFNDGDITLNEANKGAGVIVRNTATFEMKGGEISDNTAKADGGGLYVQCDSDHKAEITGGTIQSNTAVRGGGIFTSSANTVISGGTITLNEATDGAGVYVDTKGRIDLGTNAIISSNIATGNGGGIYLGSKSGVGFPTNSNSILGEIKLNSANNGGGIYVNGNLTETWEGLNVHNNTAMNGGGLYVYSAANLIMNSGEIKGNTATVSGGGVYTYYKGKLTMAGGSVTGNTATVSGSGVYVGATEGDKPFTMSGGTISGHGNADERQTTVGTGVYVAEGSTFKMDNANAVIEQNYSSTYGAGVAVAGTFEMTAGKIQYNNASDEGAGVYVGGEATFTMSGDNSFVQNNVIEANKNGGGVIAYGTVNLNGGTIQFNEAYKGAGIFARGSATVNMTAGTIYENTATADGGGLYTMSTNTTVSGGEIKSNSAVNGGGIFTSSANTVISGGTITLNEATDGAGVYVDTKGRIDLGTNAIISSNIATGNGGGIYLGSKSGVGFPTNSNSILGEIKLNSASNGGGIYVNGNLTETWEGLNVHNNTATNGGGLYVYSAANITVSGGEIKNNTATNSGGGVYTDYKGKLTMTGGNITANTAATKGSGVYVGATEGDKPFTMSSGTISGHGTSVAPSTAEGTGVYVASNAKFSFSGGSINNNHSTKNGAGVATYGTFNMSGTSTIYSNTTTGDGGAVYVGGATYTLNNSAEQTIYNNQAANGAGVVVVGTFNFKQGVITNNTATANGGGIYVNGGTLKMNDTATSSKTRKISSNNAVNGAGVYVNAGSFDMAAGTIQENTATTNGAGVYLAAGTFDMTGGTITLNQSTGDGAGVYLCEGVGMEVNGGKITNNTTSAQGGAIAAIGNNNIKLTSGEISGNAGASIKGIYLTYVYDKTVVTMNVNFNMGANDIRFNNIYANHTFLKFEGGEKLIHHSASAPLYIGLRNSSNSSTAKIDCISETAATNIVGALKSNHQTWIFAASGSSIIATK